MNRPASKQLRGLGLALAATILLAACAHNAPPVRLHAATIHDIVRTGKTGSLKYLLKSGADRDAPDPASGRTPLMTALLAEQPEAFHLLLLAGADPDLVDGVGNTALHIAALINEPWHTLDLLKAGASPLVRNAQGQTFQHYLFMTREQLLTKESRKGRSAVVEWLHAHAIVVEAEGAKQ